MPPILITLYFLTSARAMPRIARRPPCNGAWFAADFLIGPASVAQPHTRGGHHFRAVSG